jgi:hypothetical protein
MDPTVSDVIVTVSAVPSVEPAFTCPVCLESVELDQTWSLLGCRHTFCIPCLQQHCLHKIRCGELPIGCPAGVGDPRKRGAGHGCSSLIYDEELQHLLSPTQYAQHQRLLQQKQNPNLRECPACGSLQPGDPSCWRMVCQAYVISPVPSASTPTSPSLIPDSVLTPSHSSPVLRERKTTPPKRVGAGESQGIVGVSADRPGYGSFEASEYLMEEATPPRRCGHVFCFHHSDAHPTMTCEEYCKHEHGDAAFAQSQALVSSLSKPCPHCNARVELAGGCDHVRCPQCHGDWCYRCGQGNLTGKYVRSCPNCAHSFLDHQYFPRWCCLILLLLPFVVLLGLVWMALFLCIACCSREFRRQVPQHKHRFFIVCYPWIFCLLIASVLKEDPLAELAKPPEQRGTTT